MILLLTVLLFCFICSSIVLCVWSLSSFFFFITRVCALLLQILTNEHHLLDSIHIICQRCLLLIEPHKDGLFHKGIFWWATQSQNLWETVLWKSGPVTQQHLQLMPRCADGVCYCVVNSAKGNGLLHGTVYVLRQFWPFRYFHIRRCLVSTL